MSKSIIPILIFVLFIPITLLAQKSKLPLWPNVKFTKAKVYIYNLDNQLTSDYPIWYKSKLNITAIDTGYSLNTNDVDALLKIVNEDTRVLNDGLSKCYEPHHGVVFYDEKNDIVAAFDICFLCEGIKLYPKKNNQKPIQTFSEKQIKTAQLQLERIKTIFKKNNIAVLNHANEYKVLAKKTYPNDSLILINDSIFKNISFAYKNLNEFINKSNAKILQLDSTIKKTAGNDKVVFYKLNTDKYYMEASSFNRGSLWITNLVMNENIYSVFKTIKINQRKTDFISNNNYITQHYFYEDYLFIYSSNRNESLQIIFHPESGAIKRIIYNFNN